MSKKENFLEKALAGKSLQVKELTIKILTAYLTPPISNNIESPKGVRNLDKYVDEELAKKGK